MSHTSRAKLLKRLKKAKTKVKIGAKYVHTKSKGIYIVKDLVISEDNEEVRVIYQEFRAIFPLVWDRCLEGKDGWLTTTEIDGKKVPRFTLLK